jgi:hypothetical protein
VVFQYNPDTVTRTLRPRSQEGSQSAAPGDAHRVWGAPVETVAMTVEVDATDRLETGDPRAVVSGIAGELAVLEMLLHPSSALVVANTALLQAGTLEILPPEGPLTVLVWGPGRAVPVRVEGVTITEEAFSPALYPIRATVELTLRVLSHSDLPPGDPGFALYLASQVLKETMAMAAAVTGAATALSDLVGG